MHLALNLNIQVKNGTLVLTDCVGKTVTFSEQQSVQKTVSMITLGELCGLPKRALAARPLTQTDRAPYPLETDQGDRGAHHPHTFRDRWHYV